MVELVGRDEELAFLHAFVAETREEPVALVLEGEAGIGKSTLWDAAVADWRAAGGRVLSSRPAETDQGLALVGLADLFENALAEVLPALPPPRRRALEVAFLLEDAGADGADPRALATATRSALELLSAAQPLLLAIDDVQWLDDASMRALVFATRRLRGRRLRLLLARRLGSGFASTLERTVAPADLRRLALGPLSVGALHQLLRERLGTSFPRQTLLRIHERSGGNPFFALELARALDANLGPLQPLHVPETLDDLVRTRIAGLPAATRDALALASALGTAASEDLLARVGVAPRALDTAVAASVIARENGTVRFTHPLLSSVLYEDLGRRRLAVHARVAAVVGDPLLRARHLALSREAPDAATALLLDDAAALAARRGAVAVAAELAEHALRLTSADGLRERHRRALAAAGAHRDAGEWTRAHAIATELLDDPSLESLRADTLVLLAELESTDRSIALLEEALRESTGRPALQSTIHCRLAWATRFAGGLEHARAALQLGEQLQDDVLREHARTVEVILEWFAGERRAPLDIPSRAGAFAAAVGGEQLVQEATLVVANTLAPASRREEARSFLERQHADWRERNEPRAGRALWGLAWVEFWAGRWELAAAHAEHARDTAIQYGLEVPQDHLPIAVVAVHRGELDHAREHSARALALAEEQFVLHPPQHLAVMGLAALWAGDRAGAEDWLGRADRRAAEFGWREPSVRWWSDDYAELLLELGRIDDAIRIIDSWEEDAKRVDREWVLAHVARMRGLVSAARGDARRAVSHLEHAVALHEAVGDPYGEARAQLALGVARRRAREKRAARAAVAAALAGFESLGAATWSVRARRELGSIGGRTASDGLTAAERRVATLVAEGKTNREVAAALFLAERTVASHLTRVYAKLGVRSRTELARRLGDEPAAALKVQTF